MRTAFVNALEELARNDERVFLLTGDLGFSVLEGFRKEFHERFFNIGVAEANMMGIASGLSLSGKIVFVYSIAPFVTMRCFEQVRNDLCMQNANVRVVGVGGGLSYGSLGPTHHSIEDIAVMRAIPNMTVICPGDPVEAGLVAERSLSHKGPVYIRLGRGGEPVIHKSKPKLEIGKGIRIKDGDDVTIIATGNMVESAVAVSGKLSENGVSARVISMHTVKPLDEDIILGSADETKAVFTLEEHSITGGLGSAVSETLAEHRKNVAFKRFALPDSFIKTAGSQKYLRHINSLSPESITERILKCIEKESALHG